MGKVTISTKAPPGNIMPYIPLKSNKTSACVPVWNSFVKNIGGMDAHDEEGSNDPKRLAIFRTLGSGTPLTNESSPLPRILSNASTPAGECETWNEIVLGVPGNGKWETALRIHNKKREEESPINITSNARNTPLSTVSLLASVSIISSSVVHNCITATETFHQSSVKIEYTHHQLLLSAHHTEWKYN